LKISRSSVNSVEILTITGPITVQESKVLRAGIAAHLKNGKNRIVLELVDAQSLPPEVLKDLAGLDLLARELSGRIVAAGVSQDLRARLALFATPPIIPCFQKREEALKYFVGPLTPDAVLCARQAAAAASAAGGAAAPAAGAGPSAAAASAPAGPPKTREEIRQAELGELGQLRKKVSELQAENGVLQDQLESMLVRGKTPPDEAAYQQRIRTLEDRLAVLLEQLKDLKAPPKGAPAPVRR
jgi:hypothetical protein